MTGGDTIAPLDDLMNDERFGIGGSDLKFDGPTEIIPKFLEECRINSNYFALPFMRSTEACYVNVDMVKALGYELPEVMTWDFIFEVSEKAVEKNEDGTYKVNGQKTLIPFIYKSTDNMMIQMLKQKGAEYSSENGEILIFNDDTKDILYTVADAADSKSFSTFKIVSYPGNFFNAGQCIFAIDSTAGATWMGSHSPLSEIAEDSIRIFETAVTEIPQYDISAPAMISQGPSMCIFNKENKQEVLYSWLFMQYLLTDSIQIAYAQTEGYVPVTKDAQENPEFIDYLSRGGEGEEKYLEYKALPSGQIDKTTLRELKNRQSLYYDVKIAATKLLLNNTDNTFVTPVFNGSTSLRNAAGDLIEYVVRDVRDAGTSATVNEAYVSELFGKVTSLHHLDDFGSEPKTDDSIDSPLPGGAKALLISLGSVWTLLAIYFSYQFLKKRKKAKNQKTT
jgi:multiple sugar transport system substrate-binding protein